SQPYGGLSVRPGHRARGLIASPPPPRGTRQNWNLSWIWNIRGGSMLAKAGIAVAPETGANCPNELDAVPVSPYVVLLRPSMFAWLNRLNPSRRSRNVRLPTLRRPSTNIETSCVPVPRKADLLTTVPLTTGRSLVAPSPLLSTPVVELTGRADASWVTVPAEIFNGRW